MPKKMDIFGKSLNTPSSISTFSDFQPGPSSGIPSGVFAIFAVVILTLSIGSGFDFSSLFEDDSESFNPTLTESQSTYLESILSDRSRSSPILETYNTCGFLEMDLKDHLKEEMRVNLGTGSYSFRGGWGFDDMLFDDAIAVPEMAMEDGAMETDSSPSTGSDKASSNSAEGVDYSGTNNQEQGIDEADFVKTDGSYIYLVNNGYNEWGVYPSGHVHILEIPEAGNISYLSNISIEGRPTEMLLVDDKAVIYSNVQIYSYYEEKHPLAEVVKKEINNDWDSVTGVKNDDKEDSDIEIDYEPELSLILQF